jgi:hypothetical protein
MKSTSQTELEDIKRLLILLMVKLGASSQEIGLALGVDSSVVRKLFPMKSVKKLELDGHVKE